MLDAQKIITQAETTVGIEDTDPGAAENLHRLLAALHESFPVSEVGEARIHGSLMMDAVNRLESLKWVRDHPEISDVPIVAPVFLMGLPRSGTTYFQYLFDRDPRFRLIRTWESIMPSPPPGYDAATIVPRREAWRTIQEERPHSEGFEALHLYDEDGSDECHAFLAQSWGAAGLNNLYRVPAFFDWLLDGLDLAASYRVHKRQLQCLQWRRETEPWALKYPNHVLAMKEILEVYPDARMAMTHRDPAQVVASIAKLTCRLREGYGVEPVDRHQVGQDMLDFIQRHIDRIMDFDAGPNAGRVAHVDYYALVADPVGEMRKLHRNLGIDTPDKLASAVAHWHAKNPRNARGRNDYSLEQFGLDADVLREQFAPYIERFAIATEAAGLARIGDGA